MDPQHIAKFSEVRKSEYLSVEENCEQLKKFIDDYEAVKSSLTSLSEKCRHPAMVPFGKVAFMKGSLVHTNDVLVLLGDNWFVERSTKQTVEILSRRIAALQTQVGKLQTRMEQIKTEMSYARLLLEEDGDTVEIVEPCDDVTEKRWRSQHDANVRKFHQRPKVSADANNSAPVDSADYDEIWRRLEQLERDEAEAEERDDDVDDKTDICPSAESAQKEAVSDSGDDSNSSAELSQPLVINFKHSTAGPQIRERCAALCSPADIYDTFCVQDSTAASSVSATSLRQSGKTTDSQSPHVSCETADSHDESRVDSHVDPETPQSSTVTDSRSSSGESAGRKVSKFKASRMKK